MPASNCRRASALQWTHDRSVSRAAHCTALESRWRCSRADWFFNFISQTEIAEKYVMDIYHGVEDVSKEAAADLAKKSLVDQIPIVADAVQTISRDPSPSAAPAAVGADHDGAGGAHPANPPSERRRAPSAAHQHTPATVSAQAPPSIPASASHRPAAPAQAPPPSIAALLASGQVAPSWVDAVLEAEDVTSGLAALLDAEPMLFLMHAEQIRRNLELKFMLAKGLPLTAEMGHLTNGVVGGVSGAPPPRDPAQSRAPPAPAPGAGPGQQQPRRAQQAPPTPGKPADRTAAHPAQETSAPPSTQATRARIRGAMEEEARLGEDGTLRFAAAPLSGKSPPAAAATREQQYTPPSTFFSDFGARPGV